MKKYLNLPLHQQPDPIGYIRDSESYGEWIIRKINNNGGKTMNIYKLLLRIMATVVVGIMFCAVEYRIFNVSVIGAIIVNTFIATLFFLMHKSNEYGASVSNLEINNNGSKQ